MKNTHRTLGSEASDAVPAEVNTPDARAVTQASLVTSVRWSAEVEPTASDVEERLVACVR